MPYRYAVWMLLALSFTAHAQVYRCQDAQGKTIFSDQACASEQRGQLVQRERSEEQKWMDHSRAVQAQQAKAERRALEQAREARVQEMQALRAASAPQPAPVSSYTEELERRNASVGSVLMSPKPLTRAQRGLPPLPVSPSQAPMSIPVPAPSHFAHCVGGICHDNQGAVYHSHGNGTTFTGPGGGVCHKTGTSVQC